MKRYRKNNGNHEKEKEQKAGLDAIDRALSTGKAEEAKGDEQELAKLALQLSEHEQQERETSSPEFKQKMEERVEKGFKESGASKKRQRFPEAILGRLKAAGSFFDRVLARRSLALGGAATVLVALAVGIAVLQDGGGNGTTGPVSENSFKKERPSGDSLSELQAAGPDRSSKQDEDKTASVPGGAGDSEGIIAPPPMPDNDIAPKEKSRRVERSAELTLAVAENHIEEAANDVIKVSDQNRGIVLSSNVSVKKGGAGRATFDLRVPQERLAKTLRELSELGDVVLRTQSGLDITESFVTAREKLQDVRAERKSLLKQLANASTPQMAESIKQRLKTVGGRIRSLKSQLKSLRNRTDYARIDVTVQEKNGESSGSGTEDAFDDSLDFMVGVLNFGIRVFAVLLVAAIIIAAVVMPIQWIRKRRRDNTLE